MTIKYIAEAIRKNINGRPDYKWHYRDSNGNRVLFNTEKEALEAAMAAHDENRFPLYNFTALEVKNEL